MRRRKNGFGKERRDRVPKEDEQADRSHRQTCAARSLRCCLVSPDVQSQADLVTDSYDDEGFAKAMERFILPNVSSTLTSAS